MESRDLSPRPAAGYDRAMRTTEKKAQPVPARPPEKGQTSEASGARPTAEQALRLQRLAGNRAAARVLARWAAHPDPEKKGVMVPDAAASEYARFNPPQNA